MAVIRKTKTVDLVLEAFKATENAMSVVQLVEEFSEVMNKTTVYRILDRLEADGQLHSFMGQGGLKYYALCKDCVHGNHVHAHPHFQCTLCGKTECVTVDVNIPTGMAHQIDFMEVFMVGKCADCVASA